MLGSNQILCPIDCSEFSRRTFDRAVAIAKVGGGSVTVLHVAATPSASVMPYVGPEGLAPFPYPEIDRTKLAAKIKALLGLPRDVGVPVAVEIAEAHAVPEEILAQADRVGAALIVMGTHGRSGFERLLLGSVTEKVLRTAAIPVLAVPATVPALVPSAQSGFRRIVCGVDFSECSVNGLEYAADLAAAAGAALTVVHVVEASPVAVDPMTGVIYEAPAYRESLLRQGAGHLHDFIAGHVGQRAAAAEVVAIGKSWKEILRIAADQRADLIVLGIHGRNVVNRLVFGSTTDRVVRQATCPVLTVPPSAQSAAAAA
jgi:nucleotide-binding universal stress UspA family protein